MANGEHGGDTRLIASKILQYLQPWGHGTLLGLPRVGKKKWPRKINDLRSNH